MLIVSNSYTGTRARDRPQRWNQWKHPKTLTGQVPGGRAVHATLPLRLFIFFFARKAVVLPCLRRTHDSSPSGGPRQVVCVAFPANDHGRLSLDPAGAAPPGQVLRLTPPLPSPHV